MRRQIPPPRICRDCGLTDRATPLRDATAWADPTLCAFCADLQARKSKRHIALGLAGLGLLLWAGLWGLSLLARLIAHLTGAAA